LKKQYKTWKGHKLLKIPNKHSCRYCGKESSDWKELDIVEGIEPFVHRLCKFKVYHYGFTPKQYSKWLIEFVKIRKKVLERDNFTCVKCKNNCKLCKKNLAEKGEIKLAIHHIVSVRNGGTNEMNNLITVCYFCNRLLDSKR